jgi:hypothetical protein
LDERCPRQETAVADRSDECRPARDGGRLTSYRRTLAAGVILDAYVEPVTSDDHFEGLPGVTYFRKRTDKRALYTATVAEGGQQGEQDHPFRHPKSVPCDIEGWITLILHSGH